MPSTHRRTLATGLAGEVVSSEVAAFKKYTACGDYVPSHSPSLPIRSIEKFEPTTSSV